jgi:hypothetical protein
VLRNKLDEKLRKEIVDSKKRKSVYEDKLQLTEAYTSRKVAKSKLSHQNYNHHKQRLTFLEGLLTGNRDIISTLATAELDVLLETLQAARAKIRSLRASCD